MYKTNDRGKIDWSRTIKRQRPLIQANGSPVYTQYTVRFSSPNDKNLITQIHKYCVYESFSKLGWLFTPLLPEQPLLRKKILELFSQYIESDQLTCDATDIGTWEMEITDTDGKSLNFKGALCGGVTVGDTDLTYYLREQIPIQNLFAFEDNLMQPDEDKN